MSSWQTFVVVTVFWWLIAWVLPIMVMVLLPRSWNGSIRTAAAVGVVWQISVLYTAMVYNPAGIAAGIELGRDSLVMKFDNNTSALILAGGWLYPLLTCLAYIQCQKSRVRLPGDRADG